MLSDLARSGFGGHRQWAGLNAPYGAWCFLTKYGYDFEHEATYGLNAPYGARCFLTGMDQLHGSDQERVLMHLMVLGAF